MARASLHAQKKPVFLSQKPIFFLFGGNRAVFGKRFRKVEAEIVRPSQKDIFVENILAYEIFLGKSGWLDYCGSWVAVSLNTQVSGAVTTLGVESSPSQEDDKN